VRLDHLLSKEQARARASVPRVHVPLVGGALVIHSGCLCPGRLVRPPRAGCRNGAWGGLPGVGTLLGPEGTGLALGFFFHGPLPVSAGVRGRGWCCPYLENCTVDASIFDICSVAKLLRAHGGCLGIRSR
jgi:hypothetical protein